MITMALGDKDQMVTLPILSGPGKGLWIRADLVERGDVYFWGKYDRGILSQILPLIQPGWVIWDCGTYIGFYALVFGRAVGPIGRVVAFDLDSRNISRARTNAALNGLTNVQFVNAAIGNPAGKIEFIMDDRTNSHLQSTYVGVPEMEQLWRARDQAKMRGTVECISLDQALLQLQVKPNLVKIDIEGAEKVALQHAEQLFGVVRPLLVLELHNRECDRAAWDFSSRFSYKLTSLESAKICEKAEDVHGTLLCEPE
jgi:FkbM family methyltransferase